MCPHCGSDEIMQDGDDYFICDECDWEGYYYELEPE